MEPLINTSPISGITTINSIIEKPLIEKILETISKAQLYYKRHINYIDENGYKVQALIFNKDIVASIEKLTETEFEQLQTIFKEKFCKVEDHIPCIIWDSACLTSEIVSDKILKIHNFVFSAQELETNYDVDAVIGVVNFTNTGQMNEFKKIIEQLPEVLYNITIIEPGLFIGNLGPVDWNIDKIPYCAGLYVYGDISGLLAYIPPVETVYFISTTIHYNLKNIVNLSGKSIIPSEKEYLITSTLAISKLPKQVSNISLNNILIDPNTKVISEPLKNMNIEILINEDLNFDRDSSEFEKHITLLNKLNFKGLFSWNNPRRILCEYEPIKQIISKGTDFYKVSSEKLLKKEQKTQKKSNKPDHS